MFPGSASNFSCGGSAMRVTADNLALLNTDFAPYLEGKAVNAFFATYGIQFSAGHWCAGGFSDRFCRTYLEEPLDESAVGQITRVAQAGIQGVELNNEMFLDDHLQIDEGKIREVKDALAATRLIATNMNANIWTRAYY